MRGNTGTAPLKVLDEAALSTGGKRWRFASLSTRLQTTSARPSALPAIDFASNIHPHKLLHTSSSHFAAILASEAEANITASFQLFYSHVKPLSVSLPLVFRNRNALINACLDALEQSTRHQAEATVSITKCLSAIFVDIGAQYVHPLFPRIIASFAAVFDNTVISSDQATPSILWDPSNSLIPLFASLAEITRLAIQPLAADPHQTVHSLLPLLAHPHYRIREMTAESCMGYLIRKTRDEHRLTTLAASVVAAAADSALLDSHQLACAANGLGMSLFEALRLPSPRLHSRASLVITAALDVLPTVCAPAQHGPANAAQALDPRLSVLSTCFANLSRFVANEKDAATVTALFVTFGDKFLSSSRAAALAKVICLLRNWLHYGGSSIAELLGIPLLQRVLNFLSRCVSTFVGDCGVVYEGLAALCSVCKHAPSSFLQKVCRSSVLPVLLKVAESGAPRSAKAALFVVLDECRLEWDLPRLLVLEQGVGSLCDAVVRGDHHAQPDSRHPGSPILSVPALSAALSFIRLRDGLSDSHGVSVVKLKCPTLAAAILSVLRAHSEPEADCPTDGSAEDQRQKLALVLFYLARVVVPGSVRLLCSAASKENLSFEWKARFLRAICFQSLKTEADSGKFLEAQVSAFVTHLISDVKEAAAFADALQALEFFFLVSYDNVGMRMQLNPSDAEALREMLEDNLSAADQSVRLLCASNLASVCGLQKEGTMHENWLSHDKDPERCLAVGLRHIQNAFQMEGHDMHGLFQVMRYVFEPSHVMSAISTKMKFVQEIARSVQNCPKVCEEVLRAVVRFALGVLRTPLRLLWKDAGSLLRLAVGRDEELAMSIIMSQLLEVQEHILQQCHRRDTGIEEHSDEEIKTGEEIEMIQSSIEVENSGNKDAKQHKSKSESTRGFKRKRHTAPSANAVKKRKQSNVGAIASAWDQKLMMSDVLQEVLHETPVFRADSPIHKTTASPVSTTDSITFMIELVQSLCVEPKVCMKYRMDIISLHLSLDPSLFSQKRGTVLALAFTILLEKLGGLKSCETDKTLESRMRARLMSDLTMPNCELQAAVLRCLCVSRSSWIKPYRDSLIRLTQSKSFREELALITEGMFSESTDESITAEEKESIVDLLTRICFSKLRGKWSNKDSQRSAVLSFLASKLPWDIAFPKLISLTLKPLSNVVEVMQDDLDSDTSMFGMPNPVVLRAILGSIEAIVRQCRMSLPPSSWKQLAIANLIVMRNAGVGTQGQSLRSRSLRLCSEMHRIRPRETAFCSGRVIQALKDAGFSTKTGQVIQNTPALMRFVGTVMGSNAMDGKEDIIRHHFWALQYCFSLLKETETDVDTIDVGLVVAKGFLDFCQTVLFADPNSPPVLLSSIESLLSLLSSGLETLVLRLIDEVNSGQKSQKSWEQTFSKSLEVLEILATFKSMDGCMLVSVAESLSTLLISADLRPSSTIIAARALSAIAFRVMQNSENEGCIIQKSILRIVPHLSHSKYTKDPQTFGALCDLLSELNLPDLKAACRLLRSMFAMKSTKLDSPDLDERIESLNELNKMLKKGLSENNIIAIKRKKQEEFQSKGATEDFVSCSSYSFIVLFSGAFALVRSDDIAVRGNAGYAIALMAKWAAGSNCFNAKNFKTHVFESLIHGTVSSRDGNCRREYCRALGEFVRISNSPLDELEENGLTILPIMKTLSSSVDINTDVFENLVHLQAHRRGKAIRDVEKCISLFRDSRSENTDNQMVTRYEAFAKSFCLPLALNMTFESAMSSEPENRMRHMKRFQAKESSIRDVGLWAVSLAGESARLLSWEDYKACLGGILRRLRTETRTDVSGMLFKLLVKVSEAYPQYSEESKEYLMTSTYLIESVIPRMLQCVTAGAVEGDVMQDSTKSSGLRNKHGTLAFQAPVAVAIAQLMVQLPSAKLDTVISLLVTPMTNALRSRMSGVRDSAKKALTSVVLILGPKYLGYVLQQVLSGLCEGFRRDSCVYIIHSILSGVCGDKGRGHQRYSFDSVYGIVAEFLVEELKSGIDEARKEYEDPNASASRKRQSALRAIKAGECAEIMAQNITFKEHADDFCKPYVDLLANSSSSKLLHRMQECWRHIILGLSRNTSMVVEDSLVFCYKLMCWESNGRSFQVTEDDSAKNMEEKEQKHDSVNNNYKIFKLGMELLLSILVKNWSRITENTSKSREIHAMCEPFLPFIVKALKYGRDDLSFVAFKVAQKMLKLPLSGKSEMGKSLSETIVNVLSYGSSSIINTGIAETEDNLFIICLRSTAVLLSELGARDFAVVSRERVEAIISISCECVESGGPEVRVAALSVLRSLVVAQVIIPALYDAIEKVNYMAIHSQSRQLRDACTNLSVTFLVSFPLGSKRVRQYLEFFVRNLSYDLPTGRLAALNAIHAMLNKFPGPVLERESEYLFLALASMVSRDIDANCRSNAGGCLQLLFEKLPGGRKISDLLRMAITLSGLVASGEAGSRFEKFEKQIDPVVQRSGAATLTAACLSGRLNADQLSTVVRAAAAVLSDFSDENGWESIHSFLVCVEEAFAKSPLKDKKQLEVQPFVFPIWKSLPSFLLSNHQWVRLSAARLLGRHLSATSDGQGSVKNLSGSSVIWSSSDLVRQLLRSNCLQLEANILAHELAKITLENLLHLAEVLRRNPRIGDLESHSADATPAETASDSDEGRALNWLIARISGIATKGKLQNTDILRRGCALRFLLVSAKRWDRETLGRHARQYIQPVVKILESGDTRILSKGSSEARNSAGEGAENTGTRGVALDSSGITGEGLRMLAQTLHESLVEVIGTTEYFAIYNQLRNKRTEMKQTAKRNVALLAAIDPERAIKKRRKKVEGRRQLKKKRSLQSNPSNTPAIKRISLTEDL